MNCQVFQNQIGAARDGELDDSLRLQLEAHLAECCECREVAEGLDRIDALLRRASRPSRRRADELAARVTLELSKHAAQRTRPRITLWMQLAAAVAAGFLIACLVFQPWRDRVSPESPVQATNERAGPAETAPAVARVTASTGPIDVRLPDQSEWVTVTDLSPFACPSDTSVKTPSGSLCELATSSGSVVRMRDGTEVKVHAADALELNSGHVWIQVPQSGRLLVTASEAVSEAVGPAVMTCENPDPLTVTSCSGSIDVGCGSQRTRLTDGGSVQLVNGAFVSTRPSETPVLAEAWMHPLLMRKGHNDPELEARVDAMLAQIGNMKLALMYEQQIRGLGEYAALPLLKYIESSSGEADRDRRATAGRILTDIAPVWMVPELIGLLSDVDPRVRSAADRALVRLTGRESGMTPEDWRGDETDRAAAVDEWRTWWEQSEDRYTGAPLDVSGREPDELLYLKTGE